MDALDVVRACNAAWDSKDLEAAIGLITDDCVFDATGPAPDGLRHVGPDAVRAAWRLIFDDRAAQFVVEELFGAGDRVVQRWRYQWDSGHVRGIDVFRVRDGRIAEKLSYVKG